MDLKSVTQISASSLKAQSLRMRVIAENLANADSVAATPGGDPYRRKLAIFRPDAVGGVEGVKVQAIARDGSDSAATNPATRPRTPEDFRLDPDSAAARFRPAGRSRARAPADARPVRLRRHRGRVCPGQANPQPSAAQTALKEAQSIAGPKRLFGTQGLVEFAKTLAKCIAVLVVCIWVLRPHVSAFVSSSACTPLISCAPPGPCRC